MRAFGASEENVAAAMATFKGLVADDTFLVHPDNVVAVRLYRAMGTQWRIVPVATMTQVQLRRVGLIYEALEPTMRMAGLKAEPDDFARLRFMEATALKAWKEAE